MDFDLREYDGFRTEIEEWVKERWPEGYGPSIRRNTPEYQAMSRQVQKDLAAKGWLAGAWPVEYGGEAWNKLRQAVFNETMAYRRVPINSLGTTTVGPTLMVYGSEEQKLKYLNGTANGSLFWSQGFSEPNAGSDLASLQTRAVRDGDDFVINGSKIWGNHTYADNALLLARTNPEAPKHRGITQFILPLRGTPGITVQPIKDSNAENHWTLMTMEDVRLPGSQVIGEVDRGWYQTTTSLDFERSQVSWVGNSRRFLERLIRYANSHTKGGEVMAADPFIRDRLAELAVELEMARWIAYRVAYMQDNGLIPNAEASMSKVWSTEVNQRLMRAGMNLAGALGHLAEGSEWAAEGGAFTKEYFEAPGQTFAGGSSEIQRNIIATRGLGLPR
jgi:alkylation response protein AidB-like acyl-CoA dehydrogenase